MDRNIQATSYLPIIDLSNLTDSTSHDLLRAATEFGFLYVRFRNLPISTEDIDSLFKISREFFVTPAIEKGKFKIGPDDRGWSAPYVETLDEDLESEPGDFKEAFNIGEFKAGEPRQALPSTLSTRTSFLDSFQKKSRALCCVLLEHLAAALEIRPEAGGKEFFSSRHAQANGLTGSILRLLYYPSQLPIAASSSASQTEPVRCGAHTDYGSMTLLFQRPGQPGLEITSTDGTWLPVEVSPPGTEHDAVPPVVVNIGDMLQFWTRGVLRSTKHRVVMPMPSVANGDSASSNKTNGESTPSKGDRYSVAYFCHPAADTLLVGVPSAQVEEQTSKEYQSDAETLTAGEHLRRKLDKAYGWSKQT